MAESSQQVITTEDLKKPDRLIWLLKRLDARLASVEGLGGLVSLPEISAQRLRLSAPGSTPADVLTIAEAEKRYSPEIIRQSLIRRRDSQGAPVQPLITASPGVRLLTGTHAERLASSAALQLPGSLWYETDRTVYYISRDGDWYYDRGVMRDILASAPADLGANDAGFLFFITTGTGSVELYHPARWSGSGWEPGDDWHSGQFAYFKRTPVEKGWHLCDGSATLYLDIVAGVLTEVAYTPVDETGGVYSRGAAAMGAAVTPAASPSLTGSTDLGGSHNHSVSGTASATANLSGSNLAAGAFSTDVPAHTHAVLGSTDTVVAHTHGAGTLAVDAATIEPAHLDKLPYFRR